MRRLFYKQCIATLNGEPIPEYVEFAKFEVEKFVFSEGAYLPVTHEIIFEDKNYWLRTTAQVEEGAFYETKHGLIGFGGGAVKHRIQLENKVILKQEEEIL